MTHGGSWLTVTGVPVSQTNELLGASYELYWRTGTNDTTILRTTGYTHPVALHIHVQTVMSTTYFASMGTLLQTPRKRSVGGTADMASKPPVTPADLRWLYRMLAYMPAAKDRNMLGIVGFGGDYPSPADLETFTLERRTDADDATFNVVRINGVCAGHGVPNPAQLIQCRRREICDSWE
ncbi:hypothetical protein EDB92DRAFT_1833477 [Lactarius akahatsu]|uniref:Peptidase S53 activation domain-containing protein n=1 Tax=Lactarius akahatsu TaxID=416441 RepID=A0AAD4QH87_9AGAM|nr:hypothetical protein EDB92DRAFT_1833477 [Lactarius akahatsu]